jgi:hypothetical protein
MPTTCICPGHIWDENQIQISYEENERIGRIGCVHIEMMELENPEGVHE